MTNERWERQPSTYEIPNIPEGNLEECASTGKFQEQGLFLPSRSVEGELIAKSMI